MRPSGTGLGLAIAHWIADAHAGTIELADREGGGTVATVELPVRPA
jgi:signal transduction histidine kinase